MVLRQDVAGQMKPAYVARRRIDVERYKTRKNETPAQGRVSFDRVG